MFGKNWKAGTLWMTQEFRSRDTKGTRNNVNGNCSICGLKYKKVGRRIVTNMSMMGT